MVKGDLQCPQELRHLPWAVCVAEYPGEVSDEVVVVVRFWYPFWGLMGFWLRG